MLCVGRWRMGEVPCHRPWLCCRCTAGHMDSKDGLQAVMNSVLGMRRASAADKLVWFIVML